MTIDLHGLTAEEATREIMSSLISFDMSFDFELEIITGKGQGIILMTTLNILDEEKRIYDVREGMVIVYKNDKREDDNDFDFQATLEELLEK